MGFEHWGLYIFGLLMNAAASLVGGVLVLVAWFRLVIYKKRGSTVRRVYPALLSLTAAALLPPAIIGIFCFLPYSMKHGHVSGVSVGALDLLACTGTSVLMVCLAFFAATKEMTVLRSFIKITATILLLIYACGIGLIVHDVRGQAYPFQ